MAPLAPLTTEEIWRGLTGERSVHLTDFPSAGDYPADHALVAAMDAVREVASAVLSLRKARGLRVRLPLASLTVATAGAETLRPFADLLADEVNVKEVVFAEDMAAYCEQVLTVVPRVLGPRVGKQVQQVIKAVKAGDWALVDGAPVAAGVALQEGEYELKLTARDVDNSAPLAGGVVVLDTVVTPELAAEGLARDVIRVVQQARREAGLDVSDRISVRLSAPEAVAAAVAAHQDFVMAETLAVSLAFGEAGGGEVGAGRVSAGEVGDGETVTVVVSRTV
jgi:isoleucyl-tRNA synthetase